MSISDAVKTDVRRHLGYPAAGLPTASPSGGTFMRGYAGFRMTQAYGLLEWRLQALSPSEEAKLTGYAYAAIGLAGITTVTGTQIVLSISGGGLGAPVQLTIPVTAGQNPLEVLTAVANAVNLQAQLIAAGFQGVAPWGNGPWSANQIAFPQMAIICPQQFVLMRGTGNDVPLVISENGSLPEPSVEVNDLPVTVIHGFVPILNFLEGAIGTATRRLGIGKADVFTPRGNEVGKRRELYDYWVNNLSAFLGVPVHQPGAARMGRMVL